MINPYELLGVNYDTPLNDVRKAYYNLALVLHPDKGGSKEEMLILKNCYDWIKQKLEIVEQKNLTSVENDFDEFIKTQNNNKPPKLSSIIADIIDLNYDTFFEKIYKNRNSDSILPLTIMYDLILTQLYYHHLRNPSIIDNHDEVWKFIENEFNNILNQKHDNNLSSASIYHGYGNEMSFTDNEDIIPFNTDIIEYKEPESIFHPSLQVAQTTETVDKLDDYSISTKNLIMNDYKKAYSEYSIANSQFAHLFDGTADEPIDVLLACKKIERSL